LIFAFPSALFTLFLFASSFAVVFLPFFSLFLFVSSFTAVFLPFFSLFLFVSSFTAVFLYFFSSNFFRMESLRPEGQEVAVKSVALIEFNKNFA
jgi:hypothetical protein